MNFEIQKYQTKLKFNSVYFKSNLPKIKDGAHVINLDEYKSVGTHCVALYVNDEDITYFDSFGVGHFSEKI